MTVGIEMEGRLVNRKCDAMLMMHASYFSMHAQCAQAGCGFDVDGEKRRPPPAQRHVVLCWLGGACFFGELFLQFEIIEFPREIIVEFGIAREVTGE